MRFHAGLVPAAFAAPLAVLLSLGACTTIDQHEKVAGWPELQIVEHRVSDDAMRARCSKYTPLGFLPEACSEFNFDRGECDVWLSRDYPPQRYVVEHERLHCQGYDHPGDTTLRNILARYNEQKRISGSARAPRG